MQRRVFFFFFEVNIATLKFCTGYMDCDTKKIFNNFGKKKFKYFQGNLRKIFRYFCDKFWKHVEKLSNKKKLRNLQELKLANLEEILETLSTKFESCWY